MGIEFNKGRIPPAKSSRSHAQRGATPAASEAFGFPALASLKKQLNNLPKASPEQVARAMELVADRNYPPNDLLARIADLLATQAKTGSPPGQSSQMSQS